MSFGSSGCGPCLPWTPRGAPCAPRTSARRSVFRRANLPYGSRTSRNAQRFRKRSHMCAQATRRCVDIARLGALADCSKQRVRERLAELDAPLIERVDAHEHALDKCAVLVEREQLAKATSIEPGKAQGRRRPVAGAGTLRR